uniref:CARDB domain-containing protein n=1 Tax=candidate division WOR-3 bacterium TaxID=2052148 RepID=A0A7C3Z446_UNCW3
MNRIKVRIKEEIVILILTLFSSSWTTTLWETSNIRIDGPNRFSTFPMCRSLSTRGPDTLHCVFSDWQAEISEHYVYYSRSTNGGSSWSSPTSFPASSNSFPSITAWDRNVYISYPNGDVVTFRRSTDNGAHFSTSVNLNPPSGIPKATAIGCWGSNVYLIVHSELIPNNYLYFYRSTDNGANWSISPTSLGNGLYPAISVWRDTIHLVYCSSTSNGVVYYRRSTDGGEHWGDTVRLGTYFSEVFPSIDCRRGLVGVVWSQAGSQGAIYFRASTNSGTSWGNISFPGNGRWASVTVGGYLFHIVYSDSATYGNYEIRYRSTPNNGETWNPVVRLTTTSARSIQPYIHCFGDTLLHLVWTERDTVYYKKGRYLPKDLEIFSIPSPPRTIDSGSSYIPACSLYNSGLDTAYSFLVQSHIPGLYLSTASVSALPPNSKIRLNFDQFTANWPRGTYILTCSTQYNLDRYPQNDFKRCTLSIRVRDVGILDILSPPDSVDYGQSITPRARVKNFGTVNASFWTKMTIGSLYRESVWVDLTPGETMTVALPDWLVQERGTLIAQCQTKLSSDLRPENDTASKRVKVGVGDVGVVAILAPIGTYDSGFSVIPQARVKNFGTNPFSFPVRFLIGSFYTDVQSVDNLGPGEEREVVFASCPLSERGRWVVRCSTELIGDQDLTNDCQRDSIVIRVLDVAFVRRLVPLDSIRADSLFYPKVRVKNLGFPSASFNCLFVVKRAGNILYSERVRVESLSPMSSFDVEFPPLILSDTGLHLNEIELEFSGDQHPENNFFSGVFRVYWDTGGGRLPAWVPVGNVPAEPDMKRVKSGGGMTASPEGLYILKGNNTRSIYFYEPGGGIRFLDTIPSGVSGKKVKKGSAITYGEGKLYIAKGSGTKELWQLDLRTGEWLPLEIPGDKGLKGGTGLVFLPGYLYLLKGSKTQEFYRYNLSTGFWEFMPPSPVLVVDGSRMTTDGAKIYLLVGKVNLFYSFDPNTNQWTAKESLPLVHPLSGKKKKVKDGCALCYFAGDIYAVKGGNTQEFWKYDLDSAGWIPLELVPKGMSNKAVGGGAGLSAFAGKVYLLKGNNTPELWRYEGRGILFNSGAKAGLAAKSRIKESSTATSGKRVYDVLGKIVYEGRGRFALRPGIYFIEEEGKGERKKLVIIK